MAESVPLVKQNDGIKIPALGLGTYTSTGGDCERAVKDAIDLGYRHFDTAYFYENEAEVGAAVRAKIKEGVIQRSDVTIVSKLWCHFHDPERVEDACRKSLKNFGLDYIDVYLMHWPYGYEYQGDKVMFPTDTSGNVILSDVDYVDTWKAMEKLIDLRLVKSIGVSNFNSEQLTRLLSVAKIKPVHNQIECHPALNQKKLIKFCKERDIIVTAYCPLGRPDPAKKTPNYIFDDKVKEIGEKYNKTAAQIVLRYLYEIDAVPIPKSVTKERIRQNIDIFDFKLTDEEHKILDSYNTGERLIPMDHAKNSKYYPFNVEY
ncbi:aldo-keto reductase family 1 member B1-like [Condylostylus longicornis]|uniref:aldo-keto reductase family 1 member B1-like n=1 Tax=Condylostylus longicornis TaxID=2530218 RepID=UPI00244D9979|nr:aldo-keto reductase family 1 member B1-like [Condylostylus longicornis]